MTLRAFWSSYSEQDRNGYRTAVLIRCAGKTPEIHIFTHWNNSNEEAPPDTRLVAKAAPEDCHHLGKWPEGTRAFLKGNMLAITREGYTSYRSVPAAFAVA